MTLRKPTLNQQNQDLSTSLNSADEFSPKVIEVASVSVPCFSQESDNTLNRAPELIITDQKQQIALQTYKSIVDFSDDAIISKTLDGIITSWNYGAEKIFGFSAEEAIGNPMQILIPADRLDEEPEILAKISRGEKVSHFETVRKCKNGRLIHISTTISPILDEDGKVIGASKIARDITERRLLDTEIRLAAAMFESQEGMFVTNVNAEILRVNNAFTKITGYGVEEVIGKKPNILKSGKQGEEFYANMWEAINTQGVWDGEIWNKRKNGEVYPEHLTITAVKNAEGAVTNYIATLTDITVLKRHQYEVEKIAYYDPLTQLPNRRLLADRMHLALARSVRLGESVCIACLDLDGFKAVNDTHGHKAGDSVLIEAANRMLRCVRTDDTVSRLGGDEFVLILSGINSRTTSENTLKRILKELVQPFRVTEGHLVNISASIGFTLFPEDNVDSDTLLRHADHAMYAAKQAGKNCFHLFDLKFDNRSKANWSALARIEKALNNKEFCLFVQPLLNLSTGHISGAEGLVRWKHPVRGLMLPSEFLPLIEDQDLAVKLGDWAIQDGLNILNNWVSNQQDIPLSINISARQLRDKDFSKKLGLLLANYPQVSPRLLELELVESAALDDIHVVSELIRESKLLGVHFTLDNFGTGYSSLTYLQRLAVDTLKIDQSFVRDILQNDSAIAIVRGVIALAEAFHNHTIAEGVETWSQAAQLKKLGCEFAQGFVIAKPMPADEFENWLNNFAIQEI